MAARLFNELRHVHTHRWYFCFCIVLITQVVYTSVDDRFALRRLPMSLPEKPFGMDQ